MKYEIKKLVNSIDGIIANLKRNSLVGDTLVITGGDDALIIKIEDIANYIQELENKKDESVNIKVGKEDEIESGISDENASGRMDDQASLQKDEDYGAPIRYE